MAPSLPDARCRDASWHCGTALPDRVVPRDALASAAAGGAPEMRAVPRKVMLALVAGCPSGCPDVDAAGIGHADAVATVDPFVRQRSRLEECVQWSC
ncbi:hypothetical protein [Streptomyces noursei]|uniref:hypothetical protein n=1 Tax=Streptomyces noursei TaxID=1971 RepID=UPI0023B7F4E0|nr:hypothetical protein [Streptomyces noursei]